MLGEVKQIVYVYTRGLGWVPTVERVPQSKKWVKYKINWGDNDTWATVNTNVTGPTWIID